MSKHTVLVRIELTGTIEVSDETYKKLKKSYCVNANDVDLPWDDIVNLDGDVELV